MFKRFFTTIALIFKSDEDIKEYSKEHPKSGKIIKAIKGVFSVINFYIDLWNINELLKLFGKGWKKFPDIARILSNGFKAIRAAA